MGRMQDLGMTWTYLRKYRGVDEELKSFEKVNAQDHSAIARSLPDRADDDAGAGTVEETAAADRGGQEVRSGDSWLSATFP